MSLGTILLIVVVLLLLGVIPAWPHSRGWGYGPSGANDRSGRRPDVERLVPNARLKQTPDADCRRSRRRSSPPNSAANFCHQICAVLRRR
jgi:hypothetical protein